jgi:hypothetical protein
MLADPLCGGTSHHPPRLGLSLRRPGQPPAPIGLLEDLGGRFLFRYVAGVGDVADFRPLIGFPDLDKTYTATRLFPFFSQRVLQRDRPDYAEYVQLLNLPMNATVWDLIARSGGTRKGDPYEILAEPAVNSAGQTSSIFFVRGLRFAPRGTEATVDRLADLRPDEALTLVEEPTNVVNPDARLVCDARGFPLGWVPDMLLPWVRAAVTTPSVAVVAVNGAPAPWHLRLLASVDAVVRPGFRLFDESAWMPLKSGTDAPEQAPVGGARPDRVMAVRALARAAETGR